TILGSLKDSSLRRAWQGIYDQFTFRKEPFPIKSLFQGAEHNKDAITPSLQHYHCHRRRLPSATTFDSRRQLLWPHARSIKCRTRDYAPYFSLDTTAYLLALTIHQ